MGRTGGSFYGRVVLDTVDEASRPREELREQQQAQMLGHERAPHKPEPVVRVSDMCASCLGLLRCLPS